MRLYKLCNYPPHFLFRAYRRTEIASSETRSSPSPASSSSLCAAKTLEKLTANIIWDLFSLSLSSPLYTFSFSPRFSLNLFTILPACFFDILPLGIAWYWSPLFPWIPPIMFRFTAAMCDGLENVSSAFLWVLFNFVARGGIEGEGEGEKEFVVRAAILNSGN